MSEKCAAALGDVVQQTVLMMCGLDAQVVEHSEENRAEAPHEVSGFIGVTGLARGSVVISMPMAVARELSRRMLGEDGDSCTEQDISDSVGELTNVITGSLLSLLGGEEVAREARISLPGVVIGSHRVVWNRRDLPCELLRFETEVGEIAAEVNLRTGGVRTKATKVREEVAQS